MPVHTNGYGPVIRFEWALLGTRYLITPCALSDQGLGYSDELMRDLYVRLALMNSTSCGRETKTITRIVFQISRTKTLAILPSQIFPELAEKLPKPSVVKKLHIWQYLANVRIITPSDCFQTPDTSSSM